jgi:hypothetical protein
MRYFFNPVIVMFYNTTKQTWHPGLFEEKPLPGDQSEQLIVRHKSAMHHTTGFPSWSEARDNILLDFVPTLQKHCGGCENVRVLPGYVVQWDGSDIPATVVLGNFAEECLEYNKQEQKEFLDKRRLLEIFSSKEI